MATQTAAQKEALRKQLVARQNAFEASTAQPVTASSVKAAPLTTASKPQTVTKDIQANIDRGTDAGGMKYSDTQLANLQKQLKSDSEYDAAKTNKEVQQVAGNQMAERKATMISALSKNPNVSPEYIKLMESNWNPETSKMEGVTPEQWAKIPDYSRNLEKEQQVLSQFGNESNQADMLQMSYPPQQLATLIESGQIDATQFTTDQLTQLGLTPDRLQHLVEIGAISQGALDQMNQIGGKAALAKSNLDATPQPTNTMMGILQEAMNAKSNFQNQNLGVSDLFTKAGLSGYSVLAQNLSQRREEMGLKYDNAVGVIKATGGNMNDMYQGLLSQYKTSMDEFDKASARLSKADEDVRSHEQALELENVRFENDKKMDDYRTQNDIKIKKMEADQEADVLSKVYGTNGGSQDMDHSGDVNGKVYPSDVISKIFGVGTIGDWCGVFASKISTASAVGNTWAEKIQRVTSRENPTMGDKLLIPLGVKTAKIDYGHVATVLSFDKSTGIITVVESNKDGRQNRGAGKGVVSIGKYNINELQKNYGTNWGFAQGEIRPEYKKKLDAATPSFIRAGAEIATGRPQAAAQDLIGAMALAAGDLVKMQTDARNATPRAQQYFNATNDESIYNPKSAQTKAVANMSDDQFKQYISKLNSEKEAKAAKSGTDAGDEALYVDIYKKSGGFKDKSSTEIWNEIKDEYGTGVANGFLEYINAE